MVDQSVDDWVAHWVGLLASPKVEQRVESWGLRLAANSENLWAGSMGSCLAEQWVYLLVASMAVPMDDMMVVLTAAQKVVQRVEQMVEL